MVFNAHALIPLTKNQFNAVHVTGNKENFIEASNDVWIFDQENKLPACFMGTIFRTIITRNASLITELANTDPENEILQNIWLACTRWFVPCEHYIFELYWTLLLQWKHESR